MSRATAQSPRSWYRGVNEQLPGEQPFASEIVSDRSVDVDGAHLDHSFLDPAPPPTSRALGSLSLYLDLSASPQDTSTRCPRGSPLDKSPGPLQSDVGMMGIALTEPAEGQPARGAATCRHCGSPLSLSLVDLGKSPLCQTVLTEGGLGEPEVFYPLHARVCTTCWLVQIPEFVTPEGIFTEYAYFSAYSDSWVDHARRYVEMVVERLSLGADDLVVELASNDGYLLQHFLPHGIPVLGIDPAKNVAEAAIARGVPTLAEFFGLELAHKLVEEGRRPRLILGNNVLAQVPDINDFVAGVKVLLAEEGTATFEFPHLATLIEHLEYDTIYHEHFSYFSLFAIQAIFGAQGLTVIDVEEIPTHGGSLRVFFGHAEENRDVSPAVADLLEREDVAGLRDPETYRRFTAGVERSKRVLLELLIRARDEGSRWSATAPRARATRCSTTAVSAPTSSTTRWIAIRTSREVHPGTHIPIHPPETDRRDASRPDPDPALESRDRDQ